MLQISGILELHSHQLRHDSLKLINTTICGTATTNFWCLKESYFGADEDEDEAALDEAQSLAEVVKLKKQWKEEAVSSVSKSVVKPDTTDNFIIEDKDDDVASVTSSMTAKSASSATSSHQTLAEKNKATEDKFPNFCKLKEAQLFYLTSEQTMHTTGIDPCHISDYMKIEGYKGYYQCAFNKECQYVAHTSGLIATHIHRVLVGHALGCRFCPTLAWWQARYWSEHMDKKHPDQPKFKALALPEGALKAEEVDPSTNEALDHFVVEQTLNYPSTQPAVPIHRTTPKVEEEVEIVEVHTSSKKRPAEDAGAIPKKSQKFAGSDLEELFENQ